MGNIVKNTLEFIDNNTTNGIFCINIMYNPIQLKKIVELQQEKGIKKYGHSIDNCPLDKYDWQKMMGEELADFLIYQQTLKKQQSNK